MSLTSRVVVLGLATLALGTVASTASAQPAGPHARVQHAGQQKGPALLINHGGSVLAASKTFSIWWGTPSAFPGDEQQAIPQFLGGLNKSTYLATANQYMPGNGPATTSYVPASLSDTSAPPSHGPSVNTIVSEVASVLATNHLTPDASAIYFVYTSNFPKVNYCAWHSAGTIGGTTVQVAYVPNTDHVTGCAPPGGYTTAGNGFSQGTQSIVDSTAHEFMEAITDPVPVTGWADKNGLEVADKCQTFYGAPPRLGGTTWQIQGEWSNNAGGCVETTP